MVMVRVSSAAKQGALKIKQELRERERERGERESKTFFNLGKGHLLFLACKVYLKNRLTHKN